MSILLIVGSMAVADEPQPAPPRLTIKLQKKEDTFQIRRSAQQTVYLFKSPSGIGGATITRMEGDWPSRVVLRLQYDDERPYRNLEGFGLRTDRLQLNGGISEIIRKIKQEPVTAKLHFQSLNTSDDSKSRETAIAVPAAPLILDVTVQMKSTGLEIALPSECLNGSKTLSVGWIDAYRS